MKKIILFCLALFTTVLLNAQKKEVRSSGTFEAISIAIPANVHLTRGQDHKVVLEGDSDDLKNIKTEVERETLKIGSEGNQWWAGSRLKSRITIYITTPELTGVNLAGSGNVQSKDKFTAKEFNANVSGSGKMDLHIDVDKIDINISGSGKIKLAGSSKKVDINISGSGDVEAEAFKITEADINILGSGNCRLHVREKISSTIMGSGNVYFAGDPKHVNNNSMGSGRIKKL
jgi:hypothetical protein